MTELRRSNAAGFHPDKRTKRLRTRKAVRDQEVYIDIASSWYDGFDWTDYEAEWTHFGTGGF